jgi:hypothetical protein
MQQKANGGTSASLFYGVGRNSRPGGDSVTDGRVGRRRFEVGNHHCFAKGETVPNCSRASHLFFTGP